MSKDFVVGAPNAKMGRRNALPHGARRFRVVGGPPDSLATGNPFTPGFTDRSLRSNAPIILLMVSKAVEF